MSFFNAICCCFRLWEGTGFAYGEGDLVDERIFDEQDPIPNSNVNSVSIPVTTLDTNRALEEAVVEIEKGGTAEWAVSSDLNIYISSANVDGGTGVTYKCWCFISDGFWVFGQKEIIILLEKTDEEMSFPLQILYYYKLVLNFAKKGQFVDDGDHTELSGSDFLSADSSGFLYARLRNQSIDTVQIPTSPSIIAILIKKGELSFANAGLSHRILLRLGMQSRYYPFPVVSSRNRKTVYKSQDLSQSILSKTVCLKVERLIIHKEGNAIKIYMPLEKRKRVWRKLVQLGENKVCALLGSISNTADSHLVYCPESDVQPVGISIAGSQGACINLAFLLLCPVQAKDISHDFDGRIIEDGLVISLSRLDYCKFLSCLRTGSDWQIQNHQFLKSTELDTITMTWTGRRPKMEESKIEEEKTIPVALVGNSSHGGSGNGSGIVLSGSGSGGGSAGSMAVNSMAVVSGSGSGNGSGIILSTTGSGGGSVSGRAGGPQASFPSLSPWLCSAVRYPPSFSDALSSLVLQEYQNRLFIRTKTILLESVLKFLDKLFISKFELFVELYPPNQKKFILPAWAYSIQIHPITYEIAYLDTSEIFERKGSSEYNYNNSGSNGMDSNGGEFNFVDINNVNIAGNAFLDSSGIPTSSNSGSFGNSNNDMISFSSYWTKSLCDELIPDINEHIMFTMVIEKSL